LARLPDIDVTVLSEEQVWSIVILAITLLWMNMENVAIPFLAQHNNSTFSYYAYVHWSEV